MKESVSEVAEETVEVDWWAPASTTETSSCRDGVSMMSGGGTGPFLR